MYSKLDEAANLHAQYQRQVSQADWAGGEGGVPGTEAENRLICLKGATRQDIALKPPVFEGFEDMSTKVLEQMKGRSTCLEQ
jgi:hypothetical protein